jgi:hypothetical protein
MNHKNFRLIYTNHGEFHVAKNNKNKHMKLSKSLLSAILIGIAVQTTSSCKKDKELPDPKAKQEAQKEQEKSNPSEPCPACGMG